MAKTLRNYQKRINDATKAMMNDPNWQRGQIYAPPGAGKTEMFIDLVNYAITERDAKNIAIVHHRKALSGDQCVRLKKNLVGSPIYTSFHSGSHTKGYGEQINEVATRNVDDLQTIIMRSITELARPHVTLSLYQSFEKLVKAKMKFDMIICDEAHTLVQDRFSNYLADMNADTILFYTATPIADRGDFEDAGMLNFELFGKVIDQVPPTELIPQGYICAPLVHELNCSTSRRAEKADIIDIVALSYVNQFAEVSQWGMKAHQMMVLTRDVAVDIEENINSRIRELRDRITKESDGVVDGNTVDVYCVTADAVFKNGMMYQKEEASCVFRLGTRQEAIEEIKTSGKNAIVAHYDTLSEGIDISTLNGVVICRQLTKSKLIQVIGRTSRADLFDLDENGEPKRELFNLEQGIDTRLKRRGLVTFPIVDGEWVCGMTAKQVAEAFIVGGYGDLFDYIAKEPFKPTGKDRVGGDIDEPTYMSPILDASLQRELVELREMFDFGDNEQVAEPA